VSEPDAAGPGWIELRVLVPAEWAELVGENLLLSPLASCVFGRTSLAADAPAEGFELVRVAYPAEEDGPARRGEIERRLAELADAVQEPALRGAALQFRHVPERDCATAWRERWRPFRVGRIAVVTPEWNGRLRANDVRLDLVPGGAFGTGRHPTTRQCLEALSQFGAADRRIVDAGTGSGILAVAACLLGAREVLAFDVDPACVRATRELAERNGVADRCSIEQGGFERLEPTALGSFDGVLANLYADLLQEHAVRMAAALVPGGWFAFSGCSAPNAEATRSALAAARLGVTCERVRGRWHGFAGRLG
jgi:ribosomal protein L11 methyltransferase